MSVLPSALPRFLADLGIVLFAVLLSLAVSAVRMTTSRRSASGFVWRALLLSKGRIFAWIAIKTTIAVAVLYAVRLDGMSFSLKFLFALAVTVAPELLETLAETIQNEKVARLVFAAMQRTNFSVVQLLNASITRLREHANYDWQNCRGEWQFNVSAGEVGRRIRILYERNKREIANSLKKPDLLAFDAGIVPQQKFYLLIDFLGPKRLHEAIRDFSIDATLPPTFQWDGSERRRAQTAGQHPARRAIDDAHLCKLIAQGQAFPGYASSGGRGRNRPKAPRPVPPAE